MIRLDRFLANSGVGTRAEVKKLIKQKQVKVNDQVVKSANEKLKDDDVVRVNDQVIDALTERYFMFNKPAGVITATQDAQHSTFLQYFQNEVHFEKLVAAGRLDKDTTGLLIVTDDGQFVHEIIHPNKKVPKIYQAKIAGQMTSDDVELFGQGMQFKDFTAKPATVKTVDLLPQNQSVIEVTIHEGKYHQVKRMFQQIGKPVLTLHRLQIGQLQLDEQLNPGDYRALTENELRLLKTR
ncbi:pseudouridine synthase [Holzapfeliella sp. He02]|uniref:Pseudouridine synthase n=1 Tax=Holzapfeliella saturejae TaxID=3082953 RepID=A0ABU8SIC2_9LACO